MKIVSKQVGLLRCRAYDRRELKQYIGRLCRALRFNVRPGDRVLLKPNLVTAGGHNGLACTHPEFIAATAEWFLDSGARVSVGDSPAFGSAGRVMSACGITEALRGLPVSLVNLGNPRPVLLENGVTVGLAATALDCDLLVNLPKIKAHSQMYVSLAVKNYFGAVVGWKKPWIHMHYGENADREFTAVLVDLLAVLPGGITLADGITAMHETGPISGSPYPLKVIAAALNPVAMDTALLQVLGLEAASSPLWRECRRRKLAGTHSDLEYPLLSPSALRVNDFLAPKLLQPVRFQLGRLVQGGVKRLLHNFIQT